MTDYKIPSREEHNRLIRNLWKWCGIAAFIVFLLTGGTVLAMFLAGYDSKKIVDVSTSIFQVLLLSYGLGFFVPCLTSSLIKMSLGMEMSRKALDIGQQTTEVLDELHGKLEPTLKDLRYIVDSTKPVSEKLKKAVLDEKLLERLEDHLKAIRNRIDKETKPLPVKRREEIST